MTTASGKTTRTIARLFFWVSMLLLIGSVVVLITKPGFQPGLLFGGALIALALNILLAGDVAIGGALNTFTARGNVVRAVVNVKAGLCDLSVGSCPNDRVAMMRYGPMGKPTFNVKDGIGYMRLDQSVMRPNVSHWQTGLAGNVLWDVNVRSWLGDINLNFIDLRLEKVRARTSLGRMQVACPERGYVQMHLHTGLGQVEVVLPPTNEVGVRFLIKRGALSTLTVNTEVGRLLDIGNNRYITPGFDEAAAQVDIEIISPIGDVILSEE